jgi:glutamate formiminotransferase
MLMAKMLDSRHLKGCKAIGWYIEEYGIAQVSMNVTNITQTPLHVAFDEVVAKAAARVCKSDRFGNCRIDS